MFIEHQTELRSGSSFRSETEYLSPINGLLAWSLGPFYKHRIPTGFFRQPPSGGFGITALASLSESPINGAQESIHFILPGVNAWAREMSFFGSAIRLSVSFPCSFSS